MVRVEENSAGPGAAGSAGARAPDGAEPGASPYVLRASPNEHRPFRSVGFTLSSLGYAVSRRFHETLAPAGIDPREFSLLRAIGAEEGQSQQALGERLQIPPSRMVAFVDALEERGFVVRRPNPTDRRAHALYVTEAGMKLFAEAFARAVEFETELCAGLSAEEREQLLDLLGRVAKELDLEMGVHAAHSALADQ